MIDLRSDTVTKPTEGMLEAIMQAEVGDDVFEEDPTINALQGKAADMFGMEAGLYCSSGTQTNQVAIKAHCRPGDQVICYEQAHVYKYEGGGIAANAGASVKLLEGDRGILSANDVVSSINVDDVHFPKSRLVCLENTCNSGGGNYYSLEGIKEIRKACDENGLKLHLDGARLFNAIVENDYSAKDIGSQFDSISICLSKGLGAPVGSLLLGQTDFVHQARRIRKAFGGGMRQAGYLAAAGIYALDNHINRLKDDHSNTKRIAEALEASKRVKEVVPVYTNIIYFDLQENESVEEYLDDLKKENILAFGMGGQRIRFVLHLDIDQEMVEKVLQVV